MKKTVKKSDQESDKLQEVEVKDTKDSFPMKKSRVLRQLTS